MEVAMSSKSSKHRSTTPSSRVVVGRIRRPHGVGGEILVEVLSEIEGRMHPGSRLSLLSGERSIAVQVLSAKQHRLGMILQLDAFSSRDEVEVLRGAELTVDRSEVPPAPAGAYYHFDLIDCDVYDQAAGRLGKVVDVVEDGGGELLRIQDRQREVLVPFVAEFVVRVDQTDKRIDLALPPGLMDTCVSKS